MSQASAVDLTLLGNRWGWVQELPTNRARVAQVIAQGQPVAIVQTAGRNDWGAATLPAPQFQRWSVLDLSALSAVQAMVVISDRVLPDLPGHLRDYTLIYRPPTLTLGVACHRQLMMDDLVQNVKDFFAEHGLMETSITALATSMKRKHHAALVDFAEDRSIPLLAYPQDKLALLQPSAVRSKPRLSLSSEAAAMLAAGVKELLVPRQAFRGMTLAVARRHWA